MTDWAGYLGDYHERNAGITETLLLRSTDGARTPYAWLLEDLDRPGSGGSRLDLACGSAPLWPGVLAPASSRAITANGGRAYVGVDRSAAELRLAARRGAGPLVRGDATALPFADASFDHVVCSMGLMLLQPFDAALAEIARVLRPAGRLHAIVPTDRPVLPRDLLTIGRLLLALRTRLRYPNDAELSDPAPALARAGLVLDGDDRRRFAAPLATEADARLAVAALYLPGVSAERRTAGVAALRSRLPTYLPVPLRRLLAHRAP